MAKVREIELDRLILDYGFYPRTQISETVVCGLVDALQAGAELPPIRVDKASLRVADGFHRVQAHKRLKRQSIMVQLIDYASEAELFADAVRSNAAHGHRLTPYDCRRAILRAEDLGLEREQIAAILQKPVARIEELRRDTAQTVAGSTIPLKRGLFHLRGERLTERQVEANRRWGGMNAVFYARQLVEYLEADCLSEHDVLLAQTLDKLCELWREIQGAKVTA